jgi:hypothetical protein
MSGIFRVCQTVEVKTNTAELCAKEMRICGGHHSNRMETELLKACLRLRAGAPEAGSGKRASQALASSGRTTVRPSGFWQALATLATYLVDDMPTDAVSPKVASRMAAFKR